MFCDITRDASWATKYREGRNPFAAKSASSTSSRTARLALPFAPRSRTAMDEKIDAATAARRAYTAAGILPVKTSSATSDDDNILSYPNPTAAIIMRTCCSFTSLSVLLHHPPLGNTCKCMQQGGVCWYCVSPAKLAPPRRKQCKPPSLHHRQKRPAPPHPHINEGHQLTCTSSPSTIIFLAWAMMYSTHSASTSSR